MSFDFNTLPDRTGTGSLKWQKYAGRDILPMWVADMDFLSPPAVIEALLARAGNGVFAYTVPRAEITEETISYYGRRHGLTLAPEHLLWSSGLVPAITLISRFLTEPGESVATLTPVYPPILNGPRFAGRDLVTLDWKRSGGTWVMDYDRLEASLTPATRLFLLCNPHNPTGRAMTRAELERVAEMCLKRNITIVSDEIHCDLVLDGRKHIPIASLSPEVADRTITLAAPSKTYNVPGLACAHVFISNAELRRRYNRAVQGIVTEVNCFGYEGCLASYRHGEPWRQELIRVLERNRDLVDSFVRDRLPGVVYTRQEATYLAWLDVRALGLAQPTTHFEQHGVGLSDGTPFGDPQSVRLNFGCPTPRLQAALERMEKAVQAAR